MYVTYNIELYKTLIIKKKKWPIKLPLSWQTKDGQLRVTLNHVNKNS